MRMPSELIVAPVSSNINIFSGILCLTIESASLPDKIDIQFVDKRIPDKIVSEAAMPEFVEIRHDIPRLIE